VSDTGTVCVCDPDVPVTVIV
jgi:hypothetical protein